MAKVTADFDIVEEAIRQLSPNKPNQGFDMVDGIPVPEDRSVARFEIDTGSPDFWMDEDGGPSIGTLQMMDLYSGIAAQLAGPKNTFDPNMIKPPTAEEIANTSAEDLLAKTVRPAHAALILKAKIAEAGVTDPQAQDMILSKGMTAFAAGKSPTAVLNSAATGIEDFINDVLDRVNSVIGPIYTKGTDFITETINKVTDKVPLAKVLIPNQGTVVNTGTGQVTGTYTIGGNTPPWFQTGSGGFVLANPNAGGGILNPQQGPVSVSTGSPAADKILGSVLGGDKIDLEKVTTGAVIGEIAKVAGIDPNVLGEVTDTVTSTAQEILDQIENANNNKITLAPDPCNDPTSAAYNDPNLCPQNVTGGQDATGGQSTALQDLTCWNANGQSQDFKQVASCPDTFPFTSNPFDADGAQATVPIEGKGEKLCQVVDGVQYVRDANGNCVPPTDDEKDFQSPDLKCKDSGGVWDYNSKTCTNCPDGKEGLFGVCVDKCGSGQERVNGVCVDKCGSGQERVNGVCVDKKKDPVGGDCEVVDGVQYVRDVTTGKCGPPPPTKKDPATKKDPDDEVNRCDDPYYAAQNLCECFPNHPNCLQPTAVDPCEELKGECAKLGQCADCNTMTCVDCPPAATEEEEVVEEVVEEVSGGGGGGGGGFGLPTPSPISVAPSVVTEEEAELADVGPQYSISGKPLFENKESIFQTQEEDDLDFLNLESNPFVPYNRGGIVKDYAINTLIDILRNK